MAKYEDQFRQSVIGGVMHTIAVTTAVDAVEVVNSAGCKWCNGEYHTKILATAIRLHTNGDMSGFELKVNYCPNCGAKMDGDGNGKE